MISAEDDLRAWIADYYYGTVSDETVANDAEALIEWMRQRGWHFDRVPVAVQQNAGSK